MSRPTRYERVYDLAGAYTREEWGMASGHAWDRLAAIAGEYDRREISWHDVKRWIRETMIEIGIPNPGF